MLMVGRITRRCRVTAPPDLAYLLAGDLAATGIVGHGAAVGKGRPGLGEIGLLLSQPEGHQVELHPLGSDGIERRDPTHRPDGPGDQRFRAGALSIQGLGSTGAEQDE
jgi:hypothetical protein